MPVTCDNVGMGWCDAFGVGPGGSSGSCNLRPFCQPGPKNAQRARPGHPGGRSTQTAPPAHAHDRPQSPASDRSAAVRRAAGGRTAYASRSFLPTVRSSASS